MRFLFVAILLWNTTTNSPNTEDTLEAQVSDVLSFTDFAKKIDSLIALGSTEALAYAIRMNKQAVAANAKDQEAKSHQYLGKIYLDKADFPQALFHAHEALKIYEDLEDTRQQCTSLLDLGHFYRLQNDYSRSLEHLEYARALAINENFEDLLGRMTRYKANVYLDLGEYEKSITLNFESIRLEKIANREVGVYNSYHNIGYNYLRLKKYDSAEWYLRKSLNYDLDNRNLQKIGVSYDVLSKLYLDKKEFQLAEEYAKLSLQYSDSVGDKYVELVVKSILPIIYASQQKHNEAATAYEDYTLLNDSLYSARVESRIALLETEFELYKKDKELEIQQTVIKKQRSYLFALSALVASLIAVSILLLNRYRLKQRIQKLKLDKVKEELNAITLNMINTTNHMKDFENQIKTLRKKKNLMPQDMQQVLNSITVNRAMKKEWENFDKYFKDANHDFDKLLNKKHGDLSQLERRLTTLIRMDLSNREIADVLNIESRSVIMKRYRLKKKLKLAENEDLTEYILSL